MRDAAWGFRLLSCLAAVAAFHVLAGGAACSSGEAEEAGPVKAPETPEAEGDAPPPEGGSADEGDDPGETAPEEAPWKPPTFTARQEDRDRMVEVIRRYGLLDGAVLKAMAAVPRHEFVPSRHQSEAYADTPLPIGYGQTISQPYMVAEMTRLLGLKPTSRVLEIGTGSGYQAAVLTHFTPHIYTIEIVKALADSGRKRLKHLGYEPVEIRHGDGYHGWEEHAPYDAIIVTCAAGQIPPPLVAQLKAGGRMVIPVGSPFATQWLMLVEKDADGRVRSRNLMAVRFVPMVRGDRTDR